MIDCNIARALGQAADTLQGECALVARQGRTWQHWSFAQLREESEGFAAALQAEGVGRGNRVMLMVRPSMEFIALTFALFQLGAVVILIDPGMGYKNLLRCIGSVHPDILVGIPRAILFSRLFPKPFVSVRKRFLIGKNVPFLGKRLVSLKQPLEAEPRYLAREEDLAAIIFTTGSTGPPKGVQYTHGIFHAQLGLIRDFYGIGPGDVDQPCFPLFALFSVALGAKAVIPDLDPSRPGSVRPEVFIQTLVEHKVSYSFGSPAIWDVVSRHCLDRGIVLPVKKILMAGAPVSGELIQRVKKILPAVSQVFTPYGATESLPVASIEGEEVLTQTWPLTRSGRGTCVGRALPGISIRIVAAHEGPLPIWGNTRECRQGEIGEIVVEGPVVTRAYDGNERENSLAKIVDGSSFWHRMGDTGYLDDRQRLWVCGRKAHRVHTAEGIMDTLCCEAIFNEHPLVRRSALVGLGKPGLQLPVIIVELTAKPESMSALQRELCELGQANRLTESIRTFLVHSGFPVDIRHNAKIFREKLAAWAEKQQQLQPG